MNELVRVTQTAQGTADVWIGELHIKTFGGKVAHQAACDFAQQINNELSRIPAYTLTKTSCFPVAGTSSYTLNPMDFSIAPGLCQGPDGSSIDLEDEAGDDDAKGFQQSED